MCDPVKHPQALTFNSSKRYKLFFLYLPVSTFLCRPLPDLLHSLDSSAPIGLCTSACQEHAFGPKPARLNFAYKRHIIL